MSGWQDDWAFKRAAALMWPGDLEVATTWRRVQGQANADRRMQARHEGFHAFRGLMAVRNDISRIVRDLTSGVSNG